MKNNIIRKIAAWNYHSDICHVYELTTYAFHQGIWRAALLWLKSYHDYFHCKSWLHGAHNSTLKHWFQAKSWDVKSQLRSNLPETKFDFIDSTAVSTYCKKRKRKFMSGMCLAWLENCRMHTSNNILQDIKITPNIWVAQHAWDFWEDFFKAGTWQMFTSSITCD